ncbi:TRAP transporter small permease [Acuticoccus sp. M5D2P5]|uniref:TRAP transporter small permease n=1 Tax=Acuticoccus kalidii TaxID=2910977 RepID=UPI001F431787|nr:TRAP transporter small permease [Acuticoccus kalidii]MCF3935482.1 TRAP transporter small permease [Acuticoccus kalidii]
MPTSSGQNGSVAEPRWARGLRRGLDAVAIVALWIAGLTLVAILVVMNVEIVVRYLFGTSTLISDEYAGYGFVVMILTGLIYAHRRRALLRVDFALSRLKGRAGRILLGITALFSTVLAIFSAYAGYKTFALSFLFNSTSSYASETPLWIPQSVLPIGFALLALSFAEEAMRHFLGFEDRT